jgi:cell division protein ZapA (FtsZ GTPase activity inhibitor)
MMSHEKKATPTQGLPHKIVIDAEAVSLEPQALAFASRMAEPIGARLIGCFIENQALMDLSQLPFASEVSSNGTVRPLEAERLLKEWQGQAKLAEQAFSAAAETAGLDWDFEVRRGKPLFSLLEGAAQKDVVVLNATGRLTASHDVTRVMRAATQDVHADVLLTGSARQTGLFDAVAEGSTLLVLEDMTSRGEACRHAAEMLAQKSGMTCVPLNIQNTDMHEVAALVRRMAPSLVVVDNASALFAKDEDVTRFTLNTGCPILIFGSEREKP